MISRDEQMVSAISPDDLPKESRMDTKLSFHYDRDADILYINTRAPYGEEESEELNDETIARLNPETGNVEGLEVLFFSTRLSRGGDFDLPISADLRLVGQSG
jgi:uncharacterized protein YuzE